MRNGGPRAVVATARKIAERIYRLLKHGGEYVLNESSVGLCMSAASVPQGTVLIASTQESVSGL